MAVKSRSTKSKAAPPPRKVVGRARRAKATAKSAPKPDSSSTRKPEGGNSKAARHPSSRDRKRPPVSQPRSVDTSVSPESAAASPAVAKPPSDDASLSHAELKLQAAKVDALKTALLQQRDKLAKKLYAACAMAKKLGNAQLLQKMDELQRVLTEIELATSEHGGFVYLTGYGAGGSWEPGSSGLPRTERLEPGSLAEREGKKAAASRVRAIADQLSNHKDRELLRALAAKLDPEPLQVQPYEDGWKFDLRQRERGRRKNPLANSKIAWFIYDGVRSGKFKSLPKAKEAACNTFGLEESRIRAIWRAQERVLLTAFGSLPSEPRGAGVK
jgi:hypothetical protein